MLYNRDHLDKQELSGQQWVCKKTADRKVSKCNASYIEGILLTTLSTLNWILVLTLFMFVLKTKQVVTDILDRLLST